MLLGVQLAFAIRNFQDQFNDSVNGNQSAQQNFYAANPKVGMLMRSTNRARLTSISAAPGSRLRLTTWLILAMTRVRAWFITPLDPQISWTVEIGTRGEQGRFDWDLSLYYTWLHDELLELFDAQGNDRGAVNINRSYHQGIEAGLASNYGIPKRLKMRPVNGVKFNQTYTLNDFHFQNDPVYGNNRLGGIPIQLYEMDLLYEAPCGFYAGPNLQCNLTPYPVDQQNTLNADPYVLLGFKTGYVFNLGKTKVSVFVEAKNLTDEHYAAAVDPIPNAQNPPDPQIFHPGDGRSFYGGVSCSW